MAPADGFVVAKTGERWAIRTVEVDGSTLHNSSNLLIDLTSMQSFTSGVQSGELLSSSAVKFYKRDLLAAKPQTQQLFELLSNLICFDQFIIDKRALYSYSGAYQLLNALQASSLASLCAVVLFPVNWYAEAAEKVIALRHKLMENAPRKASKSNYSFEHFLGGGETTWVDDGTIKDLLDHSYFLGTPDFTHSGLPINFANTGLSVERFIMYLEASRSLGVPVSLAASKYEAMEQVGKRLTASVNNLLKKELKQMREGSSGGVPEIQRIISKSVLPGTTLSAPLLPSHIIRVALNRKWSILDAVKAIRSDPVAAAFRQYLWEHRKAFDPVYANDHLKAKQLKLSLAEMGRKITRANSPFGVFQQPVKMRLRHSNIPWVDFFLRAINNIGITLPRRPPMYEVFIARWFQ